MQLPEYSNSYLEINRQSWNNRTDAHIKSEFYDVEGFLRGASSLNDVELELLGNINNKQLLHLQCHFGQDSISLSRLGASVTGIDLSDKAIKYANELAQKANTTTSFVCCNVYDVPTHINQQFDIVYTSYGVIGWLPDLDKWANVISRMLKKGGKLVFVEFHPVVWMFDDNFQTIHYNYFNTQTIVETESGTYADRNAPITQQYVMWNHALDEVLSSLLNNGLTLTYFKEYDYSPYNCFNHTIETEPRKYRIKHLDNKIPMLYALCAEKKTS